MNILEKKTLEIIKFPVKYNAESGKVLDEDGKEVLLLGNLLYLAILPEAEQLYKVWGEMIADGINTVYYEKTIKKEQPVVYDVALRTEIATAAMQGILSNTDTMRSLRSVSKGEEDLLDFV